MSESETHLGFDKIAEALAKAQSNFKEIKKNKQGQIGNVTYKYAQLSDVIEATKKALNDNGLTVIQVIKEVENKTYLQTLLLHVSGQKIESLYGLPDPRSMDPKAFGKNLTYARRYSYCAIIGAESEEDTDGSGGEPPKNRNQNSERGPSASGKSNANPRSRNTVAPGDFKLTEGPNKGRSLKEIDVDVLIQMEIWLEEQKKKNGRLPNEKFKLWRNVSMVIAEKTKGE